MSNVAPGWYPDPHNPTQQRYWDGVQWTQHVAPPATPRSPLGTPIPAAATTPVAPVSSGSAGATTTTTSGGRSWGLWVVGFGLTALVIGAIVSAVVASNRQDTAIAAYDPFPSSSDTTIVYPTETTPPFASETWPPETTPPFVTDTSAPFITDGPSTANGTSFPTGSYVVGTDIAPGMYRSVGGGGCYWARYQGDRFSGNDYADGPTLFIVLPTDTKIDVQCDQPFTALDPLDLVPITTVTDGTWLVGIEIEPGIYEAAGAEDCYWATYTKNNEFLNNRAGPEASELEILGPEFYVQVDCPTAYVKK